MGNSWMKRFLRWQAKLQTMMRGRYGVFDKLNRALLVLSLTLIVLNLFLGLSLIRWVAILLLALVYYRVFSKKIYVRANENQTFIRWTAPLQKQINYFAERIRHRKTYKYFSCPECHQHLRAPKNKGRIKITCAKCHTTFTKKV